MAEEMTLAPGIKLGPYEILSAIGSGGMGEVWRARDTRLGRIVAIKKVKEQEYFSDGLAEEIINALTKIPKLKVIARTSSFYFRDKNVDIRQIGDRLNVHNILEGSIRKSGNRIRVTAQLINTADESHFRRRWH